MTSTRGPLHVAMTVEQCWQRVPGGSATYIVALAQALALRGDVQVTGLAAVHRDRPSPDHAAPVVVRSVGLPRYLMYRAWNHLPGPRPEWAVRGLDVVHATTWAIPPTRRPLVVTVHDLAFLRDPDHFTPRGVRFFTRALHRTRAEAAVVVVPSEATARDCVAAGIERERVRVVPHGVHPPTAEDEPDADRGIALPERYLLWCGTLEPRKNLTGLLDAFTVVADADPRLHLVLVGPLGWGAVGPDTLWRDRPWSDRVHHLGWLSQAQLGHVYRRATAFCFPSIWEGFGLPVLEAMSFGVPVVTSADTSMAEVTGDAGLLVSAHDPQDIARGILTAVGPDRTRLAAASLARARQFTWARSAELHLEAYRDALG